MRLATFVLGGVCGAISGTSFALAIVLGHHLLLFLFAAVPTALGLVTALAVIVLDMAFPMDER